MAYQWTVGEEVTAAKLNKMVGGFNNANIVYDGNDRPTTITDPVSGVVYTFTYDEDDRAVTVNDGTNTYTMTYDGDDQITSIVKT